MMFNGSYKVAWNNDTIQATLGNILTPTQAIY